MKTFNERFDEKFVILQVKPKWETGARIEFTEPRFGVNEKPEDVKAFFLSELSQLITEIEKKQYVNELTVKKLIFNEGLVEAVSIIKKHME